MRIYFFALLCLLGWEVQGQKVTGDWYGKLELPGVKLRIILHHYCPVKVDK